MYAECLMIAQGETSPDTEMINIKNRDNLTSFIEVERTSEFKNNLQSNQKYLGAELLPAAHSNNDHLKYNLKNKNVEVVIVAPQISAVQTAFDIFGDVDGLSISL